jgi:hypothetical protein
MKRKRVGHSRVAMDAKRVYSEMCSCGHKRMQHQDTCRGLALGHGSCTKCSCMKYTWAPTTMTPPTNSLSMRAAIIRHLTKRYPLVADQRWYRPHDSALYTGTWLLAHARTHGWRWKPTLLQLVPIGCSLSTGMSTWTRTR